MGCFSHDEAEFTASNTSYAEWEVSDKIEIKAKSHVHCGIKCLKMFKANESCTAIIYDEASSICSLAQLAFFETGLRLAWVTSISHGYKAWFAIDGDERSFFSTKYNQDKHPWLAIDLLVPHNISGVSIVERGDNDEAAEKTNNIAVRIGDSKPFDAETNGNEIYSLNTECGVFFGPGVRNGISVVTCSQTIIGRYVTLQRISYGDENVINWSEVLIHFKQITSKTIGILKMRTKGRIPDHAKCPATIGYSECPSTHPYSYQQVLHCCGENIDYNTRKHFPSTP